MGHIRLAQPLGRHMWGNDNDAAEGISLSGADYVRVEGFEVSDVGNVGEPARQRSGIDLYDGGNHSQIVGNHIHDIGQRLRRPGQHERPGRHLRPERRKQRQHLVENNLVHTIGRFFVGENGCGNTTVSLDHGMYLNGAPAAAAAPATSRSATTSSTTPTMAGASRGTPAA